ncbi:hypothetical protein BsWGS_06784 [Bradybaena similaris]
MGNTTSESDEEGKMEASIDVDDELSDGDDNNECDSKSATDLCHLFRDSDSLRAAATKVKEKIPENVILQHNSHILQWLESRQERLEDCISLAQFCDMLCHQGVERVDAVKAFHQFDCDGSGVADVQTMVEAITQYSNRSALGELGKSVRILQSCSLTPGFVDVYTGCTYPVEKHGARILQYLLRNRADSSALPFLYLNSFNNVFVMRSAVLKSMLNASKEEVKNYDVENDVSDLERKTIYNCFSSIEVSSNPSDAHHLRNNSMFWQSDGAARSHWVRLHVKNNIMLKHLSIGVVSTDQSYMPELVTVSVGQSPSKLREIKELKIDNHVTGRVVLLRNMKAHYPYVQINIKRCHGDGCDTRIHGVKAIGFKLVREQGITVLDASALWYLQMLTSTVTMNLPQSPALRAVLLGHTKKALESMPPLVLSTSSPEKPAFLSKVVLQEIESFAGQLADSHESSGSEFNEGMQVILALNLARGSVAGLVRFLNKIVDFPSITLPCADLLAKAVTARNNCWERLGVHLPVTFVASDGGGGVTNAGPETVIEPPATTTTSRSTSASPNRVYLTDEGKTKCSMIFKCDQNIQVTKVRIQVTSGVKGPKHGLIFVYNPESIPDLSSKCTPEEQIAYFSKYDFWREKEFEFSISYRNAGLGGMPDNPVAYFQVDPDCDEVDVYCTWNAVGKYVMVKFLEPRHESATRLGIATIKFFGFTRNLVVNNLNQKPLAVPDPSKRATCELPEIVSLVLSFVTDIAIEQVKKRGRILKPQFEFLDLLDLDASQMWRLHLACEKRMKEVGNNSKVTDQWRTSSLLVLQLMHGLIPMLASSKGTSEASREALFQQLCQIVNTASSAGAETTNTQAANKHKLVKQIIIDGAPLFFPDKTRKRLELFKLLRTVSDQTSMPSMSLVFQSLCQFFSSVDPQGLLELPNQPNHDFSSTATLDMMRSLLLVACQEMNSLKAKDSSHEQTTETDGATPNPTNVHPAQANVSEAAKEVKDILKNIKDVLKEYHQSSTKESSNNLVKAETSNQTKDNANIEIPGSVNVKKDAQNVLESASIQSKEAASGSRNVSDSHREAAESDHQMTYLVKLTASLQTALIMWCWQQLDTKAVQENEKISSLINKVVKDYVCDVAVKASQFFDICKTMTAEELQEKIRSEQPSFLYIIVRQLMLLLTAVVDKLNTDTKVGLLLDLKRLAVCISEVARANPSLFSDILSPCWDEVETDETVLRTWEVESPHDYLNHSNLVQMFHCPGASKLVVDFDPRCETERRYDYLDFTDAKGLKLRFDQKVGTPKWPRKVTFSGPYLGFVFHSDSSNTEWGYKFVVTAKGVPDVQMSWMTDLQLGLIKVLGQLAGCTLSSNPTVPHDPPGGCDDSSEQDILRSDLWTSLFRGGYMAGRLQRSLSGKFATGDESRVHSFLLEVANLVGKKADDEERSGDDNLKKQAKHFLAKCQEVMKTKASVLIGGAKVDAAITSLFVALVWHCQQLREDVDKFLTSGDQAEISEGISQAYSTAESARIQLASERQKWNSLEDKDENLDPAEILSAKALFLLKFAGLTKVQLRQELRTKISKQMMLKKAGNTRPIMRNEVMEKYPSFRLVVEFVHDPAWTSERVHQMLQERTKFASAISDIYMFAAEVIRVMSNNNPFQISVVLFFREMFAYQDKFARHYAEGLDGCGLEHESKVRRAYYALVRRLVDAFKNPLGQEMDSKLLPAYDFVQCCLLHLLDVDWQPYDLTFVNEIQLPQLLLSIAKETVKMRDFNVADMKEEDEIAEYEQSMKWYGEINANDINNWFSMKEGTKEDKKTLKMFVARFSDVLDVEISCDGCGVTLPGRRYRCLQCMDMDLCNSCFSGGVEPEEHRDNHEIVHLVYKCNHCQAFIVGTRIHCNECDDFDLCLGCHTKHKFPSGHTESHDVTRIPMVKLKTSQLSNSSLKAYIHQHVWLLYTSLTLTLSDIVYGRDAGIMYLDLDYIKIAGQLQQQCITQAITCLNHVTGEIDGEAEKEMPLEKRRERRFAMHSQERIMGLLGAVMPHNDKKEQVTGTGFNFCTEEFLNHLLKISRGEQGHELNTQHLALRLTGRLLATSDPKLADDATQKMIGSDNKTTIPGQHTIAHLFSFGAKAFEKSGLEWACSVARMLEMLFTTHQWKAAIHQHISQCVQSLKHNVQISSVFPMFVIAGFPEVLTTGTLVDYSYTSLDNQPGVVLRHFADKYQTLVVDLKTRKRHTVKDQFVKCHTEVTDDLESESVAKFVTFVIDSVARIRGGEELTVETLWIISLALKVLNQCFKSERVSSVSKKIFSSNFIQSLVYLACTGTGLNQNWLLKDLEVLSLIWYTHDGSSLKKTKMSSLKEKTKKRQSEDKDLKELCNNNNVDTIFMEDDDDLDDVEDDADDDDDDSTSDMDNDKDSDSDGLDWQSAPESTEDEDRLIELIKPESPEDTLWGAVQVDQKTKDLLQGLNTELNIPPAVLRALCNMNEGKTEGIVKSIVENFGENDERVSGFLEKWKSSSAPSNEKKDSPTTEDSAIDTGVSTHPSGGKARKIPEVADPETGDNPQNLFKQQETLAGEIGERLRGKSAQLLKKELEKHGRSGSREYLLKVNMAMCVLYARHTLTGLLAYWPETGPAISSSLLGCKDVKQIPCVLDLLYKIDTHNFFSKVVNKVIHMCDGGSLVPIAYTAAQFMEEVTLPAVIRESNHDYTERDKRRDNIQLPGASYLTVTFDSRCSTGDEDTLIFSTRKQMDSDLHVFSGSTRARWSSFLLPGDTLFYKFCLDDYDPDLGSCWGYKFTVTPGTRDSFETGHTILEAVLSSSVARMLPLGQLWCSLVYVACKQPGIQRLKAISLLLKIIALQGKACSGENKTAPDIDLKILKPLWDLYQNMTKDEKDPNMIQPAVVRSLTELFLQAENLAIEWGQTEEYLVALMDVNDVCSTIVQGLMNVAALGLEIGHDNLATDLIKKIQTIATDNKLISHLKDEFTKG